MNIKLLSDFINLEIIFLILGASFLIASSGVSLVWREKTNIIHSASHSSAFAIAISSMYAINFFTSCLISSIFLAIFMALFLKLKLSKNESISTSGTFMMVIGFAIEILQNGSQNLSKYLTGDIFLVSKSDSLYIFFVSIFLWILYFINAKKIAIDLIYGKKNWIFESVFIKTIEFFGIIYLSKSIGVLCASFPITFIPLIVRKIAKNPIQMMVLSLLISIFLLFFTYFIAIYFNCYFSFMIVLVVSLFFVITFLMY